jgi:hypothetical protein
MDVGFNRAVIFATSEHSWHGFKQVELPPEEQAAGTSRKLISVSSVEARRVILAGTRHVVS